MDLVLDFAQFCIEFCTIIVLKYLVYNTKLTYNKNIGIPASREKQKIIKEITYVIY